MTNNQTNWQELCAQLHKALEAHSTTWDDDVLLDRVWVALRAAESRHKRKLPTQAEPEPEGPTDEQLLGCMLKAAASVPGGQCTGILDWEKEAIAAARAVYCLARWGK